ncbi:MAG: XRE family transcriptional regulator [Deltaproteobacteria bacterium]
MSNARSAPDDLADRLARNIRTLREARSATQAELAKLAGLPRATWGNLESGAGNPTLQVLYRVAQALQVSLEELLAAPRASARHYPAVTLISKQRGSVNVRKLLPDPLPGMEFDRMELPPGSRLVGIPHTAGTREYLVCESGELLLVASGERYRLEPGDVVVFRGDQRHSYENSGKKTAVGYSAVLLTPVLG